MEENISGCFCSEHSVDGLYRSLRSANIVNKRHQRLETGCVISAKQPFDIFLLRDVKLLTFVKQNA